MTVGDYGLGQTTLLILKENTYLKSSTCKYDVSRLLTSKFLIIVGLLAVIVLGGVCSYRLLNSWITNPEAGGAVCGLVKSAIDPHLPCELTSAAGQSGPLDRNALWSTVRTSCIPAGLLGRSYPCVRINYWDGYAVIRAPVARGIDFITVPLRKISGVESPEVSPEEKRALDLWYIAHESFSLEMRIVYLTLLVMARGDRDRPQAVREAVEWLRE